MIRLTFACGHALTLEDTNVAPACVECGETRVSNVTTKRLPRFRGACRGPYAEIESLPGVPVESAAPSGPLRLKESHG
jgi:hypothetical protein